MMLLKQQTILLLLSVAVRIASSQTFDVASVRPRPEPGGLFTMKGGPGTDDPGRITYTNVPLKRVLLNAYDFSYFQITGPDWLDSLRFDITAAVPPNTTKAQFQAMLRDLLETRFRMAAHREPKETSIYALLVAKNGLKIKTAAEAAAASSLPADQLAVVTSAEGRDGFPVVSLKAPGLVIETKNGAARISGREVTMAKFADMLTGRVGRPVIDFTSLPGIYSFALYFTPDGPNAAESSEPNIFVALQEQLGLRLEARKAPVEYLVIDRMEKVPTGN